MILGWNLIQAVIILHEMGAWSMIYLYGMSSENLLCRQLVRNSPHVLTSLALNAVSQLSFLIAQKLILDSP